MSGVNHRKESTWEPLIQQISNRLGSWHNRFVSLGGRVVIINSILNSIPIFYLSFIKIPSRVCRPKKNGGSGIKDLRWVNQAMLGKWRWRLLVEETGLWKDILIAHYGANMVGSTRGRSVRVLGRP